MFLTTALEHRRNELQHRRNGSRHVLGGSATAMQHLYRYRAGGWSVPGPWSLVRDLTVCEGDQDHAVRGPGPEEVLEHGGHHDAHPFVTRPDHYPVHVTDSLIAPPRPGRGGGLPCTCPMYLPNTFTEWVVMG